MISIPSVKRVGAKSFTLTHCYDRERTAKGMCTKLRKKDTQAVVSAVKVANKTLYLIYSDVR